MISLTNDQVRTLRLRAQRLYAQSQQVANINNVAHIVSDLCGLQAQDPRAARLAVRVRGVALVTADVEYACVQERSVIRTWGQRGTLHFLPAKDLGWLLSLFGPVFIAASQRRYRELGLDEDTYTQSVHIIRKVLANQGPLTRAEIIEHLSMHNISIAGQARPHLLRRAALEGILCLGPDSGTEPTYALLSDWIGQMQTLSQEAAYQELTFRYLKAYGPATPEDQATWSGLPMGKIRTAWQQSAGHLIEVEIAGRPAWMLREHASWLDGLPAYPSIIRLLPSFDTYLLGYQKRDLILAPQYTKRLNAGGGMLHPALLVDGQIQGTWKSNQKKNALEVVIEPFNLLTTAMQAGLEAEITDLARFLNVKASLQIQAPC